MTEIADTSSVSKVRNNYASETTFSGMMTITTIAVVVLLNVFYCVGQFPKYGLKVVDHCMRPDNLCAGLALIIFVGGLACTIEAIGERAINQSSAELNPLD